MQLFQFLRKKTLMTIVSMMVLLQLFNISVDPADPFCGREDLSINEIESCVELVLEIVMDQENAIEESDESDETPGNPGTNFTLFAAFHSILFVANPTVNIKRYQTIYKSSDVESLSPVITAPPPKLL
jgi:hypothetical protein